MTLFNDATNTVLYGPTGTNTPYTGMWNIPNSALPAGTTTLRISYSGFPPNYPACSVKFSVYLPSPTPTPVPTATPVPTPTPVPTATPPKTATTTTLASSLNPAPQGTLVVFTANVAVAGGGSPSGGTTTFCIADAACGAASVISGCSAVPTNSSGIATCTTSFSGAAGGYSIYALYNGTSTLLGSTGSLSESVTTTGTAGGCLTVCGTAYRGGGGSQLLPNYRPAEYGPARPLVTVGTGIELKILQPDGTTAKAVSVEDLGPSEYGTMPCPDAAPCPLGSDYQDGAGNAAFFGINGANQNVFNGKWLRLVISIPATYNPTASQYWSLQYIIQPNLSPRDTLTLLAGFHGAPVHIIP